MKKRIVCVVLLCLTAAGVAFASKNPPPMPATLRNARYVYVTSYDGDQFNTNVQPEDRAAIGRVQDALQKWGKLVVVNQPKDADIVIVVESRPSEDVLAVYDGKSFPQTYLWRVTGRGGLQKGEMPLMSQFQQAFEKIAH